MGTGNKTPQRRINTDKNLFPLVKIQWEQVGTSGNKYEIGVYSMRGFNREKANRATREMEDRQKAYYFYEKQYKSNVVLSNAPYILLAERRYRECLNNLQKKC